MSRAGSACTGARPQTGTSPGRHPQRRQRSCQFTILQKRCHPVRGSTRAWKWSRQATPSQPGGTASASAFSSAYPSSPSSRRYQLTTLPGRGQQYHKGIGGGRGGGHGLFSSGQGRGSAGRRGAASAGWGGPYRSWAPRANQSEACHSGSEACNAVTCCPLWRTVAVPSRAPILLRETE